MIVLTLTGIVCFIVGCAVGVIYGCMKMDRAWGWDHMNKCFDIAIEKSGSNAKTLEKIIAYLDIEEAPEVKPHFIKRPEIKRSKSKKS